MQIISMSELQNTIEVERRCSEENGPVFVTKDGDNRLVVMDIEYFERTMQKVYEAKIISVGLKNVKDGKTLDGDTAINNIRSCIPCQGKNTYSIK